MRNSLRASAFLVIGLLPDSGQALSLDSLFTDRLILQRDRPVPILGRGAPGESVTVSLPGQRKVAAADAQGRWRAVLGPMPAGGPFPLEVKGKDSTIQLADVVVGDVWLCAGQSNMKWGYGNIPDFPADSVRAVDLPNLRYWNVDAAPAGKRWLPAGPLTRGMTAVGFFALRGVHQDQGIPVGVIQAAFGGAMIESFLPPGGPKANSKMHQEFIVPLLDFPIKGVLWYQGESNRSATQWPLYGSQLAYLIQGWRAAWKLGDIPFCVVQLPKFLLKQTDPNEKIAYAGVREAQRLALAVKNTSLVVSIDLDSADSVDIHPMDKYALGRRAAQVILAKAYGKSIPHQGPQYAGMKAEGNRIRLTFEGAGGGLVAQGGALKGFTIAGEDSVYRFADAVIEDNAVWVSSPAVASPTRVRYAFADNPACNLFNREGWPAVPFQTSGPQLPVALAAPGRRAAPVAAPSASHAERADALGRRGVWSHRPGSPRW